MSRAIFNRCHAADFGVEESISIEGQSAADVESVLKGFIQRGKDAA
jgi:hypothetical protein